MLSLKIKELLPTPDVVQPVCREICLSFSRAWLIHTKRLSLYLAPRASRLGMLALAVRGLLGRLRSGKDFEALCVHEVMIETRRERLLVATDGEVSVMETPLHYRIRPGALRVLVPVTTYPRTR